MGPKNEFIKGLIVGFLQSCTLPATERQITKGVQGRRQSKVMALRRLLAEGKILRSGSGAKSDPYLYRLPKAENGPRPQTTRQAPSNPVVYKEYVLPSGEILQLTREEFERVVDVFRMLQKQNSKLEASDGDAK